MFERLESRQLMAFSATLSNGFLQVKTGADGDMVAVHELNGVVTVSNTDVNEDSNGSQTQVFTGVNRIAFWGNTGNDTLDYKGNTVGADIRGNNGADFITVEDRGTGSSSVDGESDNDNIVIVHSNRTTVTGGSGNDTIQVNTGFNVDPSEYNYILAETVVVAGSGDDVIITNAGRTTINGGSGDDVVVDAGGAATTNTVTNVESVQ